MAIINEIVEKLKVLYVEDDAMAREEIADFLEFEVGEVITAENGEEGLEKFKKYNPDLVVTDINMPKMNGLDMAKKIKEINPNIPIIVTSAYSDGNYIIKAIEIGINKYLLKPVDVDELLIMISNSAKELVFEDTLEKQNEYIKFLIDANPSFMLVLNNTDPEYISSKFLEFLGYKNEEQFFEQNKHIKLSFKDLIDEIKNGTEGKIITFQKKEVFLVQYREFKKLDKHIFIFSKVNREKKMEFLLKKLKEECPSFREEIEEVL